MSRIMIRNKIQTRDGIESRIGDWVWKKNQSKIRKRHKIRTGSRTGSRTRQQWD